MEGYRLIGEGLNVFEEERAVEGPVKWLGIPQEVIAFVEKGQAPHHIVIARGGTTTFLSPALNAEVKGILTLQGAPESHLGILSREFQIPCILSVKFLEGAPNERGEIIPPDGTIVRLDTSSCPTGKVYVKE